MSLSSAELTDLREAVEVYLPDSAAIKRPVRTMDAQGGWVDTLETQESVACRVEPGSDRTPGLSMLAQRLGERIENRAVFVIYFPYSTDVLKGDWATVGGVDYEVLEVIVSGWEIYRRAAAIRRDD